MASALRVPDYDQRRSSTDTSRRSLRAESIAPSDSESMITLTNDDGDRTPRAHSPSRASVMSHATLAPRHQSIAAPEQASARPYRGFASEEAYLNALRAWADGKRFAEPTETTLVGFYGTTTMAEYASRPPPPGMNLNLRKKWKERRASKQLEKQQKQNERRATVA